MDDVKKIEFQVKAKDDASATFDNVRKSYSRMKNETEKPSKGGFFDILDDLKKVGGGRGKVKDVAELLVGGGAVAGITFLGMALKNATGNMVELRNAFQAGKIDAGELVEKVAAGVPILGQFWQAGRNIRELFTGEDQEIERQNQLQKEKLSLLERQRDAVREAITQQKEFKKQLNDVMLEGVVNRADPENQPVERFKVQWAKALGELDEKWKKIEFNSPKDFESRLRIMGMAADEIIALNQQYRTQLSELEDRTLKEKITKELKARREMSQELMKIEQDRMDELEKDLRARRSVELERADFQESVRQKVIAGEEGARRTGIATAALGGLSSGVAERSMGNSDPILKANERIAKNSDDQTALLRQVVAALTTGDFTPLFIR